MLESISRNRFVVSLNSPLDLLSKRSPDERSDIRGWLLGLRSRLIPACRFAHAGYALLALVIILSCAATMARGGWVRRRRLPPALSWPCGDDES